MARAKNTDRARARRRYRDTQRVNDDVVGVISGDPAEDVGPEAASPSLGSAMRGSMRMPDIAADLRMLPRMIAGNKKLWLPFIALFAAFVLAMMLPVPSTIFVAPGVNGLIPGTSLFPEGTDTMVALFVQLTLPPTALFIFFIGGFLAPRASYLVGALLGLLDGVLWSIYVISTGSGGQDGFRAGSPMDVLAIIFIAVVIGTIAAGFAAWYRNFLRQSQERARANRVARDQAMRAKAKEDERKARDEQRKAAAAAREAARATPRGTPPAV